MVQFFTHTVDKNSTDLWLDSQSDADA